MQKVNQVSFLYIGQLQVYTFVEMCTRKISSSESFSETQNGVHCRTRFCMPYNF